MDTPKTVDELDRLAHELKRARLALLEGRGWTRFSQNMISAELWQRTIDSKTYVVEAETALAIEFAADNEMCTCDDEPGESCPLHPEVEG
jgi:hypothetical protein